MDKIVAVLFDLDNTLYRNNEELEAWANMQIASQLTSEQANQLLNALPRLIATMSSEAPSAGAIADQLLAAGLPPQAGRLVQRMYDEWYAVMRLTPEAISVLEALDRSGVEYGIVTNAPTTQRIKIDRLGLTGRAQCIFISSEFGAEKPDASIFLAAAAALGAPCSEILFVGDSAQADIVGAHLAGMKTAWLSYGRTWPEPCLPARPDYTIESLIEVIAIAGLAQE